MFTNWDGQKHVANSIQYKCDMNFRFAKNINLVRRTLIFKITTLCWRWQWQYRIHTSYLKTHVWRDTMFLAYAKTQASIYFSVCIQLLMQWIVIICITFYPLLILHLDLMQSGSLVICAFSSFDRVFPLESCKSDISSWTIHTWSHFACLRWLPSNWRNWMRRRRTQTNLLMKMAESQQT